MSERAKSERAVSKAEQKQERARIAQRERFKRSARPWVVGAVVGAVAGPLLGVAFHAWQEHREGNQRAARIEAFYATEQVPPPGDAVRALLAQEGPVVIDPLVADQIPAEDVERAETILAGATVPTYLAFMAAPDIYGGYTSSGATRQWAEGVGEPGHYVVVFAGGSEETTAIGYKESYLFVDSGGQPGPGLIRAATEAATLEATPLETEPKAVETDDEWGGVAGGLGIAILAGLFVVFPAWGLLYMIVGFVRRKG